MEIEKCIIMNYKSDISYIDSIFKTICDRFWRIIGAYKMSISNNFDELFVTAKKQVFRPLRNSNRFGYNFFLGLM